STKEICNTKILETKTSSAGSIESPPAFPTWGNVGSRGCRPVRTSITTIPKLYTSLFSETVNIDPCSVIIRSFKFLWDPQPSSLIMFLCRINPKVRISELKPPDSSVDHIFFTATVFPFGVVILYTAPELPAPITFDSVKFLMM
ncbi:hypothetical protein SDJN02_13810, partial [Cucurbita argyrosperma subsp. argyrosperma]